MTYFLNVDSEVTDCGVDIKFQERVFSIEYPKEIWKKLPNLIKEALKDNLTVATTLHLPLIYGADGLNYGVRRPILEPYFFQNFIKDIPSCTDVDKVKTEDTIRKFINLQINYRKDRINPILSKPVVNPYKAIIGLSFGKDSLLTYAVAKEINLDPEIVYVVEQSLTYEQKHKTNLANEFKKEFNKKLHILTHETGKLRDYSYLGIEKSELGWGLQTTEYALELIPFAYAFNGKYILFGNEQTTNASYWDDEGKWKIYPSYDQSHIWTNHINQITQIFSDQSIKTGSLIEPLMDIMVQRILAHRYPKIAKYQMSCFTETEAGRDYHWCHDCSVCAKMYLLCIAGGIDPMEIGLKENMLEKKYKHFFTLFGGKSALTYANTNIARDEQLFAFYLAIKQGNKSQLVEEFKNSELYEEAKTREDELYNTFLRLYKPISLPQELKEDVFSIYEEELEKFQI